MGVLGFFHALPAEVKVVQFWLIFLWWRLKKCESELLDELEFVTFFWIVLFDALEHSCGRTCDDFTGEISDNGLKEDNALIFAVIIHLKHLGEKLFAGIMSDTLEEPIDGRLEKTEILLR